MTRSDDTRARYFEALIRKLLGPLAPFYDMPGVSEIMINGPKHIYVEGQGGMVPLAQHPNIADPKNAVFEDAAALRSLARAILQYSGKALSRDDLSQEARLPNKARVHIVQDPATPQGISIAIRRFPEERLTLAGLAGPEATKSLTPQAATWLTEQVHAKRNIVVSGGTGSGKTTLLNALADQINPHERIITIEDVTEINLGDDRHVLAMETQMPDARGRGGISIRDLFRAALRMRPDRILVGECRGGEALDMIQAMNSGHAGSLSTVHADNPLRAMSRLETLCLMADVDVPLIAIRRQLLEAIDIIVQIERVESNGQTLRRVSHIAEIVEDNQKDGAPDGYQENIHPRFGRAPGPEPRELVALS